jgi:hypothetical protein
MLALYFICMLMNLALPTLNNLSLFVLLLYMFISVYTRCASRRCVGMRIVVLGVSVIKLVGEGDLGTLAGVCSKQPIWNR